jgi:hypothetical protein
MIWLCKKEKLVHRKCNPIKMVDFEDVILGLHPTLATVLHTD